MQLNFPLNSSVTGTNPHSMAAPGLHVLGAAGMGLCRQQGVCTLSLTCRTRLHLASGPSPKRNAPEGSSCCPHGVSWQNSFTLQCPRAPQSLHLLLLGFVFSFQVYLVNIAGVDICRKVLSNGAANHTGRFVL